MYTSLSKTKEGVYPSNKHTHLLVDFPLKQCTHILSVLYINKTKLTNQKLNILNGCAYKHTYVQIYIYV